MGGKHFVVKPEDRNTALRVIGTNVTVLVSERDSREQQITLQSGEEGRGPPPHSHGWDESFYVTKGHVHFTCAGQTTVCSAGTVVHVPAGTIHAFSYGAGGGEICFSTGVFAGCGQGVGGSSNEEWDQTVGGTGCGLAFVVCRGQPGGCLGGPGPTPLRAGGWRG